MVTTEIVTILGTAMLAAGIVLIVQGLLTRSREVELNRRIALSRDDDA